MQLWQYIKTNTLPQQSKKNCFLKHTVASISKFLMETNCKCTLDYDREL